MGSLSVQSPEVLVVEDQDDVRLMLVTVLQMEGYRVEEASNAGEGLNRLAAHRFDLVLTDYAMPGGTGVSMLHLARARGLLGHTPARVGTAHPEIARADDPQFAVVGKPIDLDLFLEQIRETLNEPVHHDAAPHPALRAGAGPVELVLYISKGAPASVRAQQTMRRVLGRYEHGAVSFSICDMDLNPDAAAHDGVSFTPALVQRHPLPRFWLFGDLGDGTAVADLLRLSGVAQTRDSSQG
jgi:CheY-like chemotaxis protein